MADLTYRSGELTPDYYLGHFMQVVEGVQARYDFLLTDAERQYFRKLAGLNEPARLLYARLVNRRGPCFRVGKLKYPEIIRLDLAVSELLAAGLLEICNGSLDAELRSRLFACFTHAELKAMLRGYDAGKHPRKDALLAWLAQWDGCTEWLTGLLAEYETVRIAESDPWQFMRFLFFGELRDNLSDFVTRALGHVVTESIADAALVAQFTSRREADHAYRMAAIYARFRCIREGQSAVQTLAWWRVQAVDRAALVAGTAWFDRLVDRLGRLLEREKQIESALELYATSPVAPARERRARLLIKKGDHDSAVILLQAMRDAPCHNEEAYAARQLLARLQKTAQRSEARRYQYASRSVVLDYDDGGVEAAVLAHYRTQGWQGVHSENWLWNAGFGLLLWDIIYDPARGTFHSPLQFAPSDLHEPGFYGRRQEVIEARLEMLSVPGSALAIIDRHFREKNGVANPFVYWHEDLPELLSIMLHRLPPIGLAAALRHLAQDIKRHSRGLPDLFLWTETDYRFVEIKAENDHLAAHQYEWLRVLDKSGIQVSLEKIERPIG